MNTIESDIAEKYLSRLKERCMVNTYESDLNQTYEYSKNILLFILEYKKPESLKHLTFARLKSISSFNDNSNIGKFKLTLSILTDERVNILLEFFEAHDINSDESVVFNFEEISDFIINKKFINPFTEEEISEFEFSKMITTFFSVSDELLGDLNV